MSFQAEYELEAQGEIYSRSDKKRRCCRKQIVQTQILREEGKSCQIGYGCRSTDQQILKELP